MKMQGTNISMIRGDDESITVTIAPTPFAAGDTVYLTVREDAEEPIVFQKVVTTFTDGAAIIPIDSADTEGKEFGDYVYDIQVTWANGKNKTIVPLSRFTLEEEATY